MIVNSLNVVYEILFGEYKNHTCVLSGYRNRDGLVGVVFFSNHNDTNGHNEDGRTVFVKKGMLSQTRLPGRWFYRDKSECGYGLEEYFRRKREGEEATMLRTPGFAQPRVLKKGEMLGNVNIVITEDLYVGRNDTFLAHFGMIGWVELSPFLPIALYGNKNFKYPAELEVGDKFVTGQVVTNVSAEEINWTRVWLEEKEFDKRQIIKIPSCVPLALAT
jgi:hypothetical protein